MLQQTLEELLAKTAPRESSGSRTAARYDFQANYGILKLIELQESESADFRMIFDLFDDLVVLDSSRQPRELRLYQLKTKDPGEWNCSDLCSKVGAQPPKTIVSRMYAHVEAFGASVVETGFVSNAAYRVKLSDGSTTSGSHHAIIGIRLHQSEIQKIEKAVQADIAQCDVRSWLPKLVLIRTSLGVHDQELVVIGRLQRHIEENLTTEGTRTKALYETLHAAIHERIRFNSEGASNVELISRKSLTKSDFQTLLDAAVRRRQSFLENWEIIRADLIAEGVESADQLRLKGECIAYNSQRSSGEPNAIALNSRAVAWVSQNAAMVAAAKSVLEVANLIKRNVPPAGRFSELQAKAAFLVEAYEAINGSA